MKEQRAHKMYVDYIYSKAHKLIGSEYATVATFVPSQWPRFEDWTVLSICKMHTYLVMQIVVMCEFHDCTSISKFHVKIRLSCLIYDSMAFKTIEPGK
jgi:hypothetical protein